MNAVPRLADRVRSMVGADGICGCDGLGVSVRAMDRWSGWATGRGTRPLRDCGCFGVRVRAMDWWNGEATGDQ